MVKGAELQRACSSGMNSLWEASSSRDTPPGNQRDTSSRDSGRESGETSSAASSIGGDSSHQPSLSLSPSMSSKHNFQSRGKRSQIQHSALTTAIGEQGISAKGTTNKSISKPTCMFFSNQLAVSYDQFVDFEEDASEADLVLQQQQYQLEQERKAVECRKIILGASSIVAEIQNTMNASAAQCATERVNKSNVAQLSTKAGPYPMTTLNQTDSNDFSRESAHEDNKDSNIEFFPIKMSEENLVSPTVSKKKSLVRAKPTHLSKEGSNRAPGIQGVPGDKLSITNNYLVSDKNSHNNNKKRVHCEDTPVVEGSKALRSPSHTHITKPTKVLPSALKFLEKEAEMMKSTPNASASTAGSGWPMMTRSRSSSLRVEQEEMMFDLELDSLET